MTHRIHLRGHWVVSEPSPGRVQFTRRFGRPSLSTTRMNLRMIVLDLPPSASVSLNHQTPIVVESDPFSFDPGPLEVRNALVVEGSAEAGGGMPQAILEIDEPCDAH